MPRNTIIVLICHRHKRLNLIYNIIDGTEECRVMNIEEKLHLYLHKKQVN
jgi:hypothetical protein